MVDEAGFMGSMVPVNPCFTTKLITRPPNFWVFSEAPMMATERGLRTVRRRWVEGGIEVAIVGSMVTNSGGHRTRPAAHAKYCPNCLTQIGEIAIMFGFVRRGSRAAKGIRL